MKTPANQENVGAMVADRKACGGLPEDRLRTMVEMLRSESGCDMFNELPEHVRKNIEQRSKECMHREQLNVNCRLRIAGPNPLNEALKKVRAEKETVRSLSVSSCDFVGFMYKMMKNRVFVTSSLLIGAAV